MGKSIVAQLHEKINTSGLTLEAAIKQVVPGADPKFWEAKVKNFDPTAKPKSKKRTSRRSRKTSRRNFQASSVLTKMTLSSNERQAAQRATAMAEQLDRVNESRSILVTANGQTSVMEVA